MLILDFNKNPNLHIRNAQNPCRAKREGDVQKIKAQNEYWISHAANPVVKDLLTKSEVIDELLAPKYYCLEFNAI